MKKLILLFASVLALGACEKEDLADECIDPGLVHSEVLCTEIYDPVCGCDDNTYSNACVAKFHHGIKSYTKGPCSGCNFRYEGTVVDYTGLDGCGLVIELDSGGVLEPMDLPQGFSLRAGTRIQFDYVTANAGSYCMVGEVVNILCAREVSCLPLSEPSIANPSINIFDDEVSIKSAEIVDDCLEITFSHSGGCEDHEYRLVRQPLFCGTPPVPPRVLEFQHESHGDMCEALLTKTLSYDLNALRDSSKSNVEFYLQDRQQTYSEKFTYTY